MLLRADGGVRRPGRPAKSFSQVGGGLWRVGSWGADGRAGAWCGGLCLSGLPDGHGAWYPLGWPAGGGRRSR